MPKKYTKSSDIDWTPIQRAIYDILKDGRCHPRDQIMRTMGPVFDKNNLKFHLSNMRRRLEEAGNTETIICELYQNQIHYRLVIFVNSGR